MQLRCALFSRAIEPDGPYSSFALTLAFTVTWTEDSKSVQYKYKVDAD